jgi:hypothetical protein
MYINLTLPHITHFPLGFTIHSSVISDRVIIENRFDICHHYQNLVEHQVTGYIYVVIGGADVCALESAHDGPEKAEKTRKPRANVRAC